MIASSNMMKALAISAAVMVHGVAVWGLATVPEVEIEGAASTASVAIGSSFADMAAGSVTSQTPSTVTPALTVTDRLETAETLQSLLPTTPAALSPTPKVSAEIETARVSVPEIQTAARAPLPEPSQSIQPATVSAQSSDITAVARSLRPKPRSAAFEKTHKPKPAAKATKPKPTKSAAQKTTKQPTAQGNATQNAKAGSATGQTTSQSTAASSGSGQKKVTGNAAASNYPGKVMRKISRVSKPRVGSTGTAVVAFTISAGGGLSSVSLARSSGSAQLDNAALKVIKRAAPFPPPPAGAQRRFTIRIKGR